MVSQRAKTADCGVHTERVYRLIFFRRDRQVAAEVESLSNSVFRVGQ